MKHRFHPLPTLVASLVLAALVTGPSMLPGATLTGTIVYADKVPDLKPIDMSADPACKAKHDAPVYPDVLVLGPGNTMANVFVHVENPPKKSYPPPAQPVVVDQVGCVYHPHVVGVMVGQPLELRNSDGILHNVHGLPKTNPPFNVAMPPMIKQKDLVFHQTEGFFPIKCDVHPWMRGYVAVVADPFFDVTGKDGKFTITDLPAGTYEIEAWHEKLGTQTRTVTVGAEETKSVEFRFTIPKR